MMLSCPYNRAATHIGHDANKITSQIKGVPSKIAFLCILIYIYLFISSAAEEVSKYKTHAFWKDVDWW